MNILYVSVSLRLCLEFFICLTTKSKEIVHKVHKGEKSNAQLNFLLSAFAFLKN